MSDPPPQSAPGLHGILVVDKPAGITSMRAVEMVRRRAGGARTGHAGTLDPLATGVLVIAIGRATRAIERLMAGPKRYETEIDLSATTATLDAEGERQEINVASPPDRATVDAALARFRGEHLQAPPAFSAVKVGGVRAYKVARKGGAPALAPRTVNVHELEVISFVYPRILLRIRSDKGFYVRSLARDLGEALGTGGYCLSIRRTAVEPYTLNEAIPLDSVPDPIRQEDLKPIPGSGIEGTGEDA